MGNGRFQINVAVYFGGVGTIELKRFFHLGYRQFVFMGNLSRGKLFARVRKCDGLHTDTVSA